MMNAKPKSIDDYLKRVTADRRAALQKLRQTIHSILPEVEECISYNMPAFRFGGRVVGGFLATTKGCSFYPFSGRTLSAVFGEWEGTKSALHFDAKKGLAKATVKKLLFARLAEQ